MKIEQINSDAYEKAVRSISSQLNRPLHFLQAPFYGKWQEVAGAKVVYFRAKNKEKIVATGLAVAYTLPGNYYFYYCPYGPLVTKWSQDLSVALKHFFKSFNDKKLLFVRLDADNVPKNLFTPVSEASAATASLQPRNEWLLDIAQDNDLLLANMHKKARYYIRLAERKGATARIEICALDQLEPFYELLKTTAKRDNFSILPKKHYEAAFKTLGDNAFVGYVDYESKPISAALCITYDKQAHYVYGCSDDTARNLGSGYLLQWKCIQNAKACGNKLYNFGGISGSVKGTQLSGVTQFKQRFDGYNSYHSLPKDIVNSQLGYGLFRAYKQLSNH